MKRRDVLQLAGLAGAGLGAASTLQARINDETLSADRAKLTNHPFGDERIYFDGPTDQLKSMTAGSLLLKPGMSPHAPHRHPDEEFMVVTEGTGEIAVDGKLSKVGPGSMMYCEGGKLHGIRNTGTAPLLFYFYKWHA